MKQWRCVVCGYIHTGENPPDLCPVCGAGPEFFEIVAATAVEMSESDHQHLQEVVFQIPCGLFMVSSILNVDSTTKLDGMINNTVFQITDHPLQILLGMDKRHLTTEYIRQSLVFAVNFLGPNQLELIKRFGFQSGRTMDKFTEIAWRPGITGAPLLDEAPGFFECRVDPGKTIDAGTHLVFLAQVVAGDFHVGTPVLSYNQYRQRKNELWTGANG